ncbi:MFS transporter [Sphingobium sp. CCH11-B1]|jgi:MFS family permease|uniref:MFS transporter n=1 Tax=Sphingobium sp. CCH11-B1 TaxID=1768781 RepID=UPI00082B9E0A|nr:MFS transporter [Sphingobium sp. CCH11-B1]MEA3387907.1 MFS transporter [Pseudomonadota bacterium]
MQASLRLLNKRRFLPLFITQLLGAFNDNLFKNAMVLFVVYQVYNDERSETWFSALATGLFILPFFLLSALSGQLADQRDKATIIRWVKAAEILIMAVGAAGLALIWSGIAVHSIAIPLLLAALFAMGIHSTFFGPIKYAILPQHLHDDEVLGGTGLVEAGTYIAILAGTILAGLIPVQAAAVGIVVTALIGYVAGRKVPPAPSLLEQQPIDFHIIRSSVSLVRGTMHIRRLFLAIMSISLFWAVGSILFIQFPPLVKNVLTADKPVASLFLAIFSIGIAIGSIAINRLLQGHVSAKYAPASVIGMGACIVAFHVVCDLWTPAPDGQMLSLGDFLAHPLAIPLSLCLLGVATFGGMFVVPLYAFLTTTVEKCEAARTVAANNIVNSGAMVAGSLCAIGLSIAGVSVVMQLLLVAVLSLPCAAMAWKLHKACDGPLCRDA